LAGEVELMIVFTVDESWSDIIDNIGLPRIGEVGIELIAGIQSMADTKGERSGIADAVLGYFINALLAVDIQQIMMVETSVRPIRALVVNSRGLLR
jgi:hypothetical protein